MKLVPLIFLRCYDSISASSLSGVTDVTLLEQVGLLDLSQEGPLKDLSALTFFVLQDFLNFPYAEDAVHPQAEVHIQLAALIEEQVFDCLDFLCAMATFVTFAQLHFVCPLASRQHTHPDPGQCPFLPEVPMVLPEVLVWLFLLLN